MPKIAWATDIHLDTLEKTPEKIVQFAESLIVDQPDAIVLTGDLSTYADLTYHLSIIERVVQRPVYFVLGNHDFWGGGVSDVRLEMKNLSNMSQFLRYLPNTPYVTLSPTTALVGHDCWYDAGYGSPMTSTMIMNDWIRVKDFAVELCVTYGDTYGSYKTNKPKVIEISKKLASEGTAHIINGIKAATKYHKVIMIATHFPPFQETHLYNGKVGDAAAQPWYTNKMLGDVLRQAASQLPKVRFEVFAGHTHGKCDMQISDNLFVHVGEAEYKQPRLQNVITVPL
jgi:predicted phosphohydrolase